MRVFIFSLIILTGCLAPDKTSLKVSRETRKQRKSPVILKAETSEHKTIDKLELRENNSFFYESYIKGTQKAVIYAGSFSRLKDTLVFNFHNNHKDSLWTGQAVIDTSGSLITLISKKPSDSKQLTITRIKHPRYRFPAEKN